MTSDLAAIVPKRRAFDWSTRIHVANVFTIDTGLSMSLPAIVVGLAGAAAIVYVSTRHARPVALPPAATPEAIEPGGVTLVK